MSGEEANRPIQPSLTWNARRDEGWICPPISGEVSEFHRSLPGYEPTALRELPELARQLGVGRVFAKDESSRLGLPAFKALGASWAIHRALREAESRLLDDQITLVCATDGNHGRAVARFARELGHSSHVFVPDDVHPNAISAIQGEDAEVTVLRASYDETVEAAARFAGESQARLLIQDTAWPGYEQIPTWIVEGYSTLFSEIDEQLHRHGIERPDLIVVPAGVGSLLQAALQHYRHDPALLKTRVMSVEPVTAASVFASVSSGQRVTIETGGTAMAGLNCGTVSSLAWPHIATGLDGCVTVTDSQALGAARDLAVLGVDAGPCGGASLAAVRVMSNATSTNQALTEDAVIILLITEGAEANPRETTSV